MWKDVDLEQIAQEDNAFNVPRPPEEVEEIVVMTRLQLYNRGLPCGPKTLRLRLDEHEHLRPLPSERTIARILARNGLTHGRTGLYEYDRAVMDSRSVETSQPPESSADGGRIRESPMAGLPQRE